MNEDGNALRGIFFGLLFTALVACGLLLAWAVLR